MSYDEYLEYKATLERIYRMGNGSNRKTEAERVYDRLIVDYGRNDEYVRKLYNEWISYCIH